MRDITLLNLRVLLIVRFCKQWPLIADFGNIGENKTYHYEPRNSNKQLYSLLCE